MVVDTQKDKRLAGEIKADFFKIKSDYKEAYENLSPELREQIDFMMKL